jgi:formylglycine-generating enzyme required for sulfatase activity
MRSEELQISQLEALLGDKYRIVRRIGGGGMAQVFLARHRGHGGAFAIKVLAEHLAEEPRIVARFEQEARTAASLSGHPNIAPIFDVGQGEGLHFIIMQFVSGEDMASYLRRNGKLAPADAANVLAQTTEALVWAEARRVVHRDLKPANMLLDGNGRVVILDFGISKAADVADGLTRPGESVGTQYYMSPEQIRGQACDARSDLYSLGVVFFELLTGKHPFDHETVTAIQMAHLTEPPPSPLSLEPGLPEVCGQLIEKLMQKRPEDRFQSPRELLDQLVVLGASSAPGALRPQMNTEIEEELRQPLPGAAPTAAVVRPRQASGGAVAGNGPGPAAAIPDSTPVAVGTVAAETPIPETGFAPPATAPAALPAQRKGHALVWIAAALTAVAIALVAIVMVTPAKLPVVIQGPHGQMNLVPAGSFVYGDNLPDAPRPRQTATLPAFYVDETEVSNRQYRQFVEATGHTPPATADYSSQPDLPVSGISYDDATAYAAWAGERLPSEEEWEKAARGTDGRAYPWGNEPWTSGVPISLQPVNSFADRKSPYGALNMAGNVFEWTSSRFPAGEREFTDMQQLLGNSNFSREWYVIKGGSFSPHGDVFFRCSYRRGLPSDQHSPVVGLRCVRSAPKPGFFTRLRSLFGGG